MIILLVVIFILSVLKKDSERVCEYKKGMKDFIDYSKELLQANALGPRQNISKELSSGIELSNALREYPKVFDPIIVGLIQAGEAGGVLSEVLESIINLITRYDFEKKYGRKNF